MQNAIQQTAGGTIFSGQLGVDVYRATVIASGLRMYAKCGMLPNRAYTPTKMLKAAEQITGKKFKRGQYLEAADALKAVADEVAGHIKAEAEGQ